MHKTFLFACAFYSMVYMSNTVYSSYFGLYLADLGLGKAHIGIINTVAGFIMLLSQPIWGSLGD